MAFLPDELNLHYTTRKLEPILFPQTRQARKCRLCRLCRIVLCRLCRFVVCRLWQVCRLCRFGLCRLCRLYRLCRPGLSRLSFQFKVALALAQVLPWLQALGLQGHRRRLRALLAGPDLVKAFFNVPSVAG